MRATRWKAGSPPMTRAGARHGAALPRLANLFGEQGLFLLRRA